ncbi:MAG: photosystem I reaction center protein subunit XI [Leptolyngbya sp. SIO4C1]|nr:photosystem I reaction center protein subunit XI [Leptolyngbya sp. SIO4C1]
MTNAAKASSAITLVDANVDPQVGHLATPISGSAAARTFINNLPAYRQGLSPFSRGLEIGVAHGYWFYGPFALLGPLRNSEIAGVAGALSAVSFVFILTVAMSIYAASGPKPPTKTVTVPNPPAELGTREGWSNLASGFLIGGCSGAFFAYLLNQTPVITNFFLN